VTVLLELGANISLPVTQGRLKGKTALQIAQIEKSKHEIIQLLTKHSPNNSQFSMGTTSTDSRNVKEIEDMKNQISTLQQNMVQKTSFLSDKDNELKGLKKKKYRTS